MQGGVDERTDKDVLKWFSVSKAWRTVGEPKAYMIRHVSEIIKWVNNEKYGLTLCTTA